MPQAAKTYESLAEASDNNLDMRVSAWCPGARDPSEKTTESRGIRQASFPVIKTLESFDFKAILHKQTEASKAYAGNISGNVKISYLSATPVLVRRILQYRWDMKPAAKECE